MDLNAVLKQYKKKTLDIRGLLEGALEDVSDHQLSQHLQERQVLLDRLAKQLEDNGDSIPEAERLEILEWDREIEERISTMLTDIKSEIGDIQEQRKILIKTRKANNSYFKGSGRKGGYFIDQKK